MNQIRARIRVDTVLPAVALVATLVLFAIVAGVTGRSVSPFDAYNTLQGVAQLGLLALPLGLTMIAGEFDLSVVGVSALGGMLAVQTGQDNPLLGVGVAILAGAIVGVLQGTVIARLRLASMPVTIATYIILLGATSVISKGLTVTYTNIDATLWVDQLVLEILSPRSIIALSLFVLIALLLGHSRLGPELRAIGDDRRAARVSGVRADGLLIGLFVVSGSLAALGGALLSYSYSSANPDPGIAPLVLAVVAALIGGVSLSGGRGSAWGLLVGTVVVALLSQIVIFATLPGFVTQLVFAGFLTIVLIVDAPGIRLRVSRALAQRRESSRQGGTA
jgi:ribose/xylose/arabinose/galactoside ABC-type transport system permease subunit